MPTLFLDTQVWNYLVEPDWSSSAGVSSARLLKAIDGWDVVSSVELVQELMGTLRSDRAKYRRMIDLMQGRVGPRVLHPLNNRHIAEAQSGGLMATAQRYVNRDLRRDLWREARTATSVREIADLAYAESTEYKAREEEIRAKVLADLTDAGEDTRPRRLRAWYAQMDIDEWVRAIAQRGVERGLFTTEVNEDCGPTRYPSAWMFTAFRLARLPDTLGEGRSIKGSDLADAHHISCDPYVDLVVSNDRPLARTVDLMLDRGISLGFATLDDFLEQ